MSWQAYVDTSLVGTGNVDKAAIASVAGDSIWAHSTGFKPTPQEMQTLVKAFSNPADLFGSGIHVGGEKYVTIKADDRSLYGKQGKTGIIIVKTKQAILIAHHPESVASPKAASTVEALGDYLINSGY